MEVIHINQLTNGFYSVKGNKCLIELLIGWAMQTLPSAWLVIRFWCACHYCNGEVREFRVYNGKRRNPAVALQPLRTQTSVVLTMRIVFTSWATIKLFSYFITSFYSQVSWCSCMGLARPRIIRPMACRCALKLRTRICDPCLLGAVNVTSSRHWGHFVRRMFY